jgi:hypothetical protein
VHPLFSGEMLFKLLFFQGERFILSLNSMPLPPAPFRKGRGKRASCIVAKRIIIILKLH